MEFYLGTHQPHWLRILAIPLMVSRRTLAPRKSLPVALHRWMRDSGGFTQLQMYGSWDDLPSAVFVKEAQRHVDEIGNVEYLAPRDWMCEPIIIKGGVVKGIHFVGTKLSVVEHQERTVQDFLDLRERAPHLPWMSVIQGWDMDDYLRCVDIYHRAGVELASFSRVGVGTICRRQGTKEAAEILNRLSSEGLRLHAFGLKGTGIPNVAPFLASSDSLAWSFAARNKPPLPECAEEMRRTGKGHKNCANCMRYALFWLEGIERSIAKHRDTSYQQCFVF